MLFVLNPRLGPPPLLFHTAVIQSDCSLVCLSAAWLSLFYTLSDNAWESPSKEQGPQANMVSVSFVLLAARSPPAAARHSAPLLTGEVKEIKWNIPSLIPPNALWHPHSAETAGTQAQRESDKTNSTNWERDPTPRDACTSFTLISPDRRGLVHTTFNKLWRMFWVALGDSTQGAVQRKPTIKLHKLSVHSAFISYKSLFIARHRLVYYWSFSVGFKIIRNLSIQKIQNVCKKQRQLSLHNVDVHRRFRILCWTQKEKESWQSDVENINVWNGHYYFIQMPLLCLKNLSGKGSANTAHVKRKPRDRRRFQWERRAYAKTTCVAAISKQWRCGEPGRRRTFLVAEPAWGAAAGALVLWNAEAVRTVCVWTQQKVTSFGSLTCIWLHINIKLPEKFCQSVAKL